jgi:broad-specificity NMP kinase
MDKLKINQTKCRFCLVKGGVNVVTCYFGLPGCGKTTMMTKLAQLSLRNSIHGKGYKRVYTTWECAGCYRLDADMMKSCDFSDSVLYIDEKTRFVKVVIPKKFVVKRKIYNLFIISLLTVLST